MVKAIEAATSCDADGRRMEKREVRPDRATDAPETRKKSPVMLERACIGMDDEDAFSELSSDSFP